MRKVGVGVQECIFLPPTDGRSRGGSPALSLPKSNSPSMSLLADKAHVAMELGIRAKKYFDIEEDAGKCHT